MEQKPTYEEMREKVTFYEHKIVSLQDELTKAYNLLTNVQALYKISHEENGALKKELEALHTDTKKRPE